VRINEDLHGSGLQQTCQEERSSSSASARRAAASSQA
jgi:hypothetical protein